MHVYIHVIVFMVCKDCVMDGCLGVMVAKSVFHLLLDKGMTNPSTEVRAIR